MRRELPWRDPWAVALALAAAFGQDGLVWLDGDGSPAGPAAAGGGAEPFGAGLSARSILAVAPLETLCCRGLPGEPGAHDPFAALERMEAQGGDWLGWLGYEAGAWVEAGDHWQRPAMATLWAGRYDHLLHINLKERQLWLEGCGTERLATIAAVVEALPEGAGAPTAGDPAAIPISTWHWHTDAGGFAAQVEQLQAWIAAGDLFQANLTACCETTLAAETDLLALYGRLRRACPAPFSGLAIANGAAQGEAVLSASPERFLRLSADGQVETRPIKGTRPRRADPEADAREAAELITSPKDRAENVMIVDLLRNDLGRVCVAGSISVPQLVGLESYRQVHHLTSVVEGRLRPGLGVVDLLRACWPGGSISGAPKVRACRRLNALEPVPRGPYCGSLFHLAPGGAFDGNILIRSLLINGRQLRVHAGCGIVADSDPAGEAEEMGWKIQPLLEALT
ncbi:anthranilate synthase component I family protein [Cyanobium sp. ATX 6F1]|uniref:anthranilate synthase component I family protein n=1 Tax=Cyanobium sp. ATX 6F1 TaxID=2823702 RepID=UPI0020CE820A|nr:anthranilate synthase component I family protein [Cyanobium sp. ATX 6F1]MCP9917628.1 anthranilate synthase component I family protein [Cyanobium sp. ATX 6F1]